ncbi:antibiotic biosynthesis monooxygenase [Burkholderia sp. Bp8963]|uniref:antibiotic biosynthesis monooxygenase family protein n=1 Tax=Burkholderia sp. Bp8963 TaxID=2184547 RepID=UPI000F59C314|nr:antibiotic biosynthesis monooxygenase [Burkholderia sp. Bp8963]RQS74510.1 antibiotic biosynthesis monooxygenase [Burkholderia sp. Bp8963]
MYIAAFIYRPGEIDDTFRELSATIDAVAASLPGFAGAESWRSADGQLVNASYYWHDEASLRAFATDPRHLDAKRQYRNWYGGYHVVVSKVERAYGDGAFPHIVADTRRAGRRHGDASPAAAPDAGSAVPAR